MNWINRHPLTYTAIVVAVLLTGWECLARKFTVPPPNKAPLETLSLALHDPDTPLPASTPPRLLILGNSQIHYVRDHDDSATFGFPAQLEARLKAQGRSIEVADLSAGGQQVVESLAILIDTFERVRPDHVILGLGLANMRGTTIPPQLVSTCDWKRVRHVTTQLCDEQAEFTITPSLLQLYSPSVPTTVAHDPTIQERLDEVIAEALTAHSAAVRHRTVMADWVAKLPGDLEREVRMTWRKKIRQQFKARTYDAGDHYELSLTAVHLIAAYCQQRRVPFTIISMPYYPNCEPVVYVPDDEQRLDDDLRQLADRQPITWLDLTQALLPEHYGTFPDGSIDGLHFLATGHARLAETVAPQLGRLMTASVEEQIPSRH